MESLKQTFVRLVREEEGAAASEYAVLVGAIALAVSLAVVQFDLDTIFGDVSTYVQGLATP